MKEALSIAGSCAEQEVLAIFAGGVAIGAVATRRSGHDSVAVVYICCGSTKPMAARAVFGVLVFDTGALVQFTNTTFDAGNVDAAFFRRMHDHKGRAEGKNTQHEREETFRGFHRRGLLS